MTDYEKKELKAHNSLMELYIQNLKQSADLIPSIIEEVKKFDCKVYNARLENALQKIVNPSGLTIHAKMEGSLFQIELCFYDWKKRSVRPEGDGIFYLPNSYEKITLAYNYDGNWNSFYPSQCKGYHEKNAEHFFYIDDKYNYRLNADRIVELLTEGKKDLEEKITILSAEMLNAEDYIKQVEDIQEKARSLNNAIPYQIRDFYHIKSYANWQ